jgi:hypothetical protein
MERKGKARKGMEKQGMAKQGMAWVYFKVGYILTTLQIF